MIVEQNILFSF